MYTFWQCRLCGEEFDGMVACLMHLDHEHDEKGVLVHYKEGYIEEVSVSDGAIIAERKQN